MPHYIINIFSSIFKLLFYARHGQKLHGTIYRSVFKGMKGNELCVCGSFVKNKIILEGKGNQISVSGRFDGGFIRIIGNDNRLIVEPGCTIIQPAILIRGNNAEIIVGKNSSFRTKCKLVSVGNGNHIHIGDNCLFSDEVNIWNSDTHQITNLEGEIINPSRPIDIDEHVWIGRGVSVTKGVHIGKDSIIGMASVVSRDIPANTIAAGVPAKVIKENTNWNINFVKEVVL